jgi:CAAX protease family protein
MRLLTPDNRLLRLARQGGRLPAVPTAIAVTFVILVVAGFLGQIPAHMVLLRPDGTPRFTNEIESILQPILLNVTVCAFFYLGLWVWLRLSSKRPFWTLGFERKHALRRTVCGIVIAGLMIAATAGLSIMPGVSFAPGLVQTMGLTAFAIRFLSLCSYFVQGPGEEMLFRGWLMPVIGARHGTLIGVVVSSLFFSLAHAGSRGITWLGFLNLFLFGVFASVYALAEGGIWGIGAWHAFWNWTRGDLLGFATDGSPHTGLLNSIIATGPDIISGGAFGLEGGLACTTVFLIAIATMVIRSRCSDEGRATGSITAV